MINVVNEEELLMHDYSTVKNCPVRGKKAVLIESRVVQLFNVNSLIQTSEEDNGNNVVKRRLIHFQSGHISCINNYLNEKKKTEKKATYTTAVE